MVNQISNKFTSIVERGNENITLWMRGIRMSDSLVTLYKFVDKYFEDKILNARNHKGMNYAKITYSRILKYVKACLILRENSVFEESQAPIMRSLIEASVDLQLIRNYPESYPILMDLSSLKEAKSFLKDYQSIISEATDEGLSNEGEMQEVDEELQSLRKRVSEIPEFNFVEAPKIKSSTGFKFALLKQQEANQTRHKKYAAFFDVLCGHTHNNLCFIYRDSIKNILDIQRNIIHFDDLIASIMKNGLINVLNVFGEEMSNKEFEKLKRLKRAIKKPTKDITSLFSGSYRLVVRPEYRYLYDQLSRDDEEEE